MSAGKHFLSHTLSVFGSLETFKVGDIHKYLVALCICSPSKISSFVLVLIHIQLGRIAPLSLITRDYLLLKDRCLIRRSGIPYQIPYVKYVSEYGKFKKNVL